MTDDRPVILAVDPDRDAIARVTAHLDRYADDYRIDCGSSIEDALAKLERLREAGELVAVVLAGRGEEGLRGEELLERVNDLHPHAKRGLMIEFGAWGDEDTADAIRARDGARAHRLLRAQALERAGRALPPHGLGVPARVAAREHGGPPGADRRRRSLLAARVRAPQPARAERCAACVPRERHGGGQAPARSLRPRRRERARRAASRRHLPPRPHEPGARREGLQGADPHRRGPGCLRRRRRRGRAGRARSGGVRVLRGA